MLLAWLYWALVTQIVYLHPLAEAKDLDFTDIPEAGEQSPLVNQDETGMDAAFCSNWNPDFGFRGAQCCGLRSWQQRRRGLRCSPQRAKENFCDEMTSLQRDYLAKFEKGEIRDVLSHLQSEFGRYGEQAQCDPNNGFLTWGRPLLATDQNRIQLRRPDRCVNFGTDRLVALLEWLGREVGRQHSNPEFQTVKLLVGDMSAPRGGCLAGHGGRVGHKSHTNGLDVDLGFLQVHAQRSSPREFSREFDAAQNWWLLKKILTNPYACVSAILLDRRHIQRLNKVAADDEQWPLARTLLKHVRHHYNHFHIRIEGDRQPDAQGMCK